MRVRGTDKEIHYHTKEFEIVLSYKRVMGKDGIVNKEWQLFYHTKEFEENQYTFADSDHRYYICLHEDEGTGSVCNYTKRSSHNMVHRHNSQKNTSASSSPNEIYRKRSKLFIFPDLRYYLI